MSIRIFETSVLPWQPRSRVWANLFLISVVLLASFMAFQALRITIAGSMAESADVTALEKALSLDPSNPALHHRLGEVLFHASGGGQDFAAGLVHLRRATELNPVEALYWLDLAAACESAGDTACTGRSLERALELSPRTPRVLWSAANYHLRTNRSEKALPIFQRLLKLDPAYAPATFQVCVPLLGPVLVEEEILGGNRDPRLQLAFVNFLGEHGQDGPANAGWGRLEREPRAQAPAQQPPFTFSEVEPYLDHLIESGAEPQALRVWNDLERMGVVADPGSQSHARPDDLVFNGSFEQPPLNAGFDWRYQQEPFVSAGLTSAAHSGSHGLQIEFSGEQNGEYEPVYQFVPVDPGRSYLLSAFVRSDAISSDSGPRLRVLDPACPDCLSIATETTVATTSWHAIHLAFATGPKTDRVRISVWRPRSRAFPPEISGTFWLDDVSLVATSPFRNLAESAFRKSDPRTEMASIH